MSRSQRYRSRQLFLVLTFTTLWSFPANPLFAQTSSGPKSVLSEWGPQKEREKKQSSALVGAYQTVLASQNEAQQQGREISLNAGRTVERVLTGSETHSYSLLLASRQYLHAAVEQRGIDIVVVLRGPAGNQLFEMDGVVGPLGTEDLVGEATDAGSYTLELRARTPAAPQGQYALRVELKDGAGAQEHAWIDAQRLFMEGRQAQDQATGERLQQASKTYSAALQRWRDAGEQRWEAATLHNLGLVQLQLGDLEQSRDSCEAALLIERALKDQRAEGRTLNNLGSVYRNLGDFDKARERTQRALEIWRELRNRRGEGVALNGLGNIYTELNQGGRARDCYEQALVIWREIKERKGEAQALTNLGNVCFFLLQFDCALNYFEQALVISRDENAKADEAILLNNFGGVYARLGQIDKSRDYFRQALTVNRELKDRIGEAFALTNLGVGYLDEKNGALAREHLEQALLIWREIKNPRGEAGTLYKLAHLARQKGEPEGAYAQASAALSIIESMRSGVAGHELRSSFRAWTGDYFEFCIDLLMQMHRTNPRAHHDAEALAITERARARSLLDLLTEARAEVLEGADQRLVAKEHELQQQLNATATAQQQLLSGTHTSEQAAAIEKQLGALTGEYQDMQVQLRRSSLRYAALVQPQPLNLHAMQTQLLDRDTLLLVYSLGAERSYLWAVTPESLSSFELPRRELLEAATRRFLSLLAPPQQKDQEGAPRQKLQATMPQIEVAARALSQMLLSPVSAQLGNKRLLIVSDGALQYVPFAALPVPSTVVSGRRSQPQPLILGHEIVSLPSASTLAALRDELKTRQPAPKALAVLADPVFSAGDKRLEAARGASVRVTTVGFPIAMRSETPGGKQSESQAALNDELPPAGLSNENPLAATGLERELQTFLARGSEGGLPRLPFARREAEAITSFAPPEATFKALDFQASRETATNPALGQYRIVHFVTHGLLNTEHPELSGLVLSLVDEQGRAQDGFLRLNEVYNLHLPVELVVLSACQTGLGKEIKGEGLIGLTRGFMYAGAARVVASLWRVDDVATAELMRRFYLSMLRDGQRPAAALRTAQIAMWQEGVWRSPYYWAGFVLQGEWR